MKTGFWSDMAAAPLSKMARSYQKLHAMQFFQKSFSFKFIITQCADLYRIFGFQIRFFLTDWKTFSYRTAANTANRGRIHIMATPARKQRGRPKSPFTEGAGGTMQALDRALGVLTAVARQEGATLSDLSMAQGIPAATVHRILATLQKHRFAALDEETQTWTIGIEAYRTGTAYLKRSNMLDISRPVMRRLMERTGETANLAVPDGAEVVFVGQVESLNPIRAFFNPGTRTPMHASGTGKAILAQMGEARARAILQTQGLPRFTDRTLVTPADLFEDLAATRARGWSFDREERHEGMSCMGAAILDFRGEPIAGVSISGPSSRFTDRTIADFGAELVRAAAEITSLSGGQSRAADPAPQG